MIATPKDGRIQIEKLKYAVEVKFYFELFHVIAVILINRCNQIIGRFDKGITNIIILSSILILSEFTAVQ